MKPKTAGGFWIAIIVLGVFLAGLITFAIQTWELVTVIFPDENLFMKVGAVVSLDVMSIIYAATEMFYPFKDQNTKHLATGMWLVTFVLALVASCIYMYISSLHLLHGVLDITWLAVAYAIVILAMAGNVIAVTCGIRLERSAKEREQAGPTTSTAAPASQPAAPKQPALVPAQNVPDYSTIVKDITAAVVAQMQASQVPQLPAPAANPIPAPVTQANHPSQSSKNGATPTPKN
jgi:hypothetical protein